MASDLNLEAVIGFEGSIKNGLRYVNRNGTDYLIYALGSTVVVKNINENTQSFCQGHSNKVSCIAVSNDGSLIASGQTNYTGFKADVIVWSLDAVIANANTPDRSGELVHRLTLHHGKVQDLAFSCDDQYLATVGGQDDNALVIWKTETGAAICGTPAANDSTLAIQWYKNRSDRLVTCGNMNIRVWSFSEENRKVLPTDVVVGQLRRINMCIALAPDDSCCYIGTKTGDLLQVALNEGSAEPNPRFQKVAEPRFSQGILCMTTVPFNNNDHACLLGCGDGKVCLAHIDKKKARSQELMGSVTSLALAGNGFFAGTSQANTYYSDDLSNKAMPELRSTCHYGCINDIVYPKECSELFITCSVNDIRIWNSRSRQELLRIQVPNLECNCIDITPNGGSILSGWNDGKIRAFYPETGSLKFVIQDAHTESCTAIAVTHDDDNLPPWRVVSGGQDGRVRVWKISQSKQIMEANLKEHRAPVNCIRIMKDNTQCVSASSDGSCIVWDLVNFLRLNAMFANTNFAHIMYHPDESQMLTCGSDRKITYWDAFDGNAIRIMDGSDMGAAGGGLNCMDIEPDGQAFATGGEDKTVKLWHYDEGETIGIGNGHSGAITAIRISPDQRSIVSTGSEGAIFVWSMPAEFATDLAADGDVPKAGVEDEVEGQ